MFMEKVANLLMLISSGLLAGAFAYGFFAVVPTFYEVPLEVHLTYRHALMRHNGIYMQIIVAGSILAPIWWALTMDGPRISRGLSITASFLSIISFVVTRFGNVPINRMIKTWSAAAPPADYGRLLERWMTFNALRTATSALGFACVTLAMMSMKKHLPR
jgi:uncharacterized membrane protein